MYCPNEAVMADIIAQVHEMKEIFATEVVVNYKPECNPIIGVFNIIRLVHGILVFAFIFVLILLSIIILRYQRQYLPPKAYKLQVRFKKMNFIIFIVLNLTF